jgi:hypothetical protein
MIATLMDSISNPDVSHLTNPSAYSRPSSIIDLTIHLYLPIAVVYFFFNAAGLPPGLFCTTVFSPLLYLWLYLKGQRWLTTKFLLALSPFIFAHLVLGIESPFYYMRSLLLLWTVYVTVYMFCWALLKSKSIDRLFDQLIVLNFCVALFAVANLFTPLKILFWRNDSNTIAGASNLLRLSLLTSEPSVYAGLMLPLLIFASLRLFHDSNNRNLMFVIMIGIPLLLSQSFGGLSIGLAGIGISLMTNYRRFFRRQRTLIIFICLAIAVVALLVTHNPISERVMRVATGNDSSTNSRTTLSFIVALSVASAKSMWWGVGLGQAKLVDVSDLGIGFGVGIIPNAIAGTFAELGLIGVFAGFAVELYLFFKTKVYWNSFRLAMFIVAFLTQLTGSYVMDVQLYLMWCFAFFTFFPALNLCGVSSLKVSHSQ